MSKTNRKYKDRLFTFIFGNPQNREWTLSLYNAVNGSDYTNAEDIEFTTIENAVYMGMKNDVSFLVENTMNFYEHQSSYNPNMPLRFFLYAAMVYEKRVFENPEPYDRFSSVLQNLPAPKCICFYNGTDTKKDREILKLSNAFTNGEKSDIEVKVTMLNINFGYNKEILEACKPLYDYSWLVNEIRKNQKKMELEEAVDKAIDALSDGSPIRPFIMNNRAEVKHMYITEYDQEMAFKLQKAEGFSAGKAEGFSAGKAEGRAEGKAEGRAEGRVEGKAEGKAEERENGIKILITTLQAANFTKGMTKNVVIEKYQLTEDEADKYMQLCWNE